MSLSRLIALVYITHILVANNIHALDYFVRPEGELKPAGGGPTGYSTAILLRDKAQKNIVRFNTCVTANFNCLVLGGNNAETQCCGNIMLADANTIQLAE